MRLASPYDTDTRWSAKRDIFWNGYKLHVSETCHPQADGDRPARPNLITNVATTYSTLPDSKTLDAIHHALQHRSLLPARHYLDSGYPSADLIISSRRTYGIALVTPVLLDTSSQARTQEGFAAHDFTIDWENSKAVCPAGKTSTTWTPNIQDGVPKTVVSFAALDCIPCPYKRQCTSARGNRRQLSLYPKELTEAIRDARAQQQTGDWQRDYALRSGVEGTIRQATHTTGLRRARYRGLAKTHLDHSISATALNLIRLHAWWNGHPLDRANHSHLARLQLSLAA
ncbi:transposase [Streptacidiphilus pinicola]|uniref:transposase n=1 Tax=Streptacidiphilus pinicola TaxID=2219663 RepID=UPI001FB4ED98|nr:transposase [Streptacidiphilus pinicola]